MIKKPKALNFKCLSKASIFLGFITIASNFSSYDFISTVYIIILIFAILKIPKWRFFSSFGGQNYTGIVKIHMKSCTKPWKKKNRFNHKLLLDNSIIHNFFAIVVPQI